MRRFLGVLCVLVIILSVFTGVFIFQNRNKNTLPKENLQISDQKDIKKPLTCADEERIKEHIRMLTSEEFMGRRAGTEGEAEAGLYLARQLKDIGIEPLGQDNTYFQSFTIPYFELKQLGKRTVFCRSDNSKVIYTDNILGLIPSKKRPHEYIVLSAHFDHLGLWNNYLYKGANDNASGVGAILEIARVLSKNKEKLPYSIIIAFFSAEEMGLIGSNYFINHPTVNLKNIKLNINLDSIGNGIENNFLFWSEHNSKVLDNLCAIWSNWEQLEIEKDYNCHHSSDHEPFNKAGIPALTILAKDWLDKNHTPLDTMEILNFNKIQVLSQYLVELLNSPKLEKIIHEY